jgi:hypothetical protein
MFRRSRIGAVLLAPARRPRTFRPIGLRCSIRQRRFDLKRSAACLGWPGLAFLRPGRAAEAFLRPFGAFLCPDWPYRPTCPWPARRGPSVPQQGTTPYARSALARQRQNTLIVVSLATSAIIHRVGAHQATKCRNHYQNQGKKRWDCAEILAKYRMSVWTSVRKSVCFNT